MGECEEGQDVGECGEGKNVGERRGHVGRTRRAVRGGGGGGGGGAAPVVYKESSAAGSRRGRIDGCRGAVYTPTSPALIASRPARGVTSTQSLGDMLKP